MTGLVLAGLGTTGMAQGTKLWTVDRYDELQRGTSEGSAGRALMLLGGSALGLQERTTQLLKSLPTVDPKALHALGVALAGNDRTTLMTFVDTVECWLIERLGKGSNTDLASLARVSEVWEKVQRDARDTQEYNLERKPLVFSVFGMLAEAMRMR